MDIHNYIMCGVSICDTDLDDFVRECVRLLIKIDGLATIAIIFVVLGISWLVRVIINLKEDKWDE